MSRRSLPLAVSALLLGSVIFFAGFTQSAGLIADTMILKFSPIAVPVTDAEKAVVRSSANVTIADTTHSIGYRRLLTVGDINNGETFGQIKDYTDTPVTVNGKKFVCNGTDGVSEFTNATGSGPDHISILQKNGKLYSVTQFECSPGAMYSVELEQSTNGALTVRSDSMKFISQKSGFGGWVHCAGITTPWQSHLGSEEYEADAKNATANKYFNAASTYFWAGDASKNNPYYYGWTPEVTIDASGNPVYAKHYAMGRFAHELAYVMPDNKTVYLSDDGTNVGLFMFVADTPADLSSGKLYAAKWTQVDSISAGAATLSWIDMGSTSDAVIKAKLDPDNNIATNDGITFATIFNTQTPGSGVCETPGTGFDGNYKSVMTANGNECLSLKDLTVDGKVDISDIAIASRLETRRIAAMMGATTEFNKEEGITFNARDNKLYIAMSDVSKGMQSATGSAANHATGGNDHISLTKNVCGAVYELDVGVSSTVSGSSYVASNMKTLIAGTPLAAGASYAETAYPTNHTCDVNGIANPDNVAFLEGTNMLVIGEDGGYHPEDAVWAYDINTKALTRIATVVSGAEATSPFWHKNINGKGYLTLTVQHPFGEAPYKPKGTTEVPADVELKSEVGYIGNFDFSKLK
jgi:hypothetical protein